MIERGSELLTGVQGSSVLIAGANGFLGRNLMWRLAEMNTSIHAISRSVPEGESVQRQVRWTRLDLTDLGALRRLIRELHPDFVFHLASDSRGGRELELVLPSFNNDVLTTINVLLATSEASCKRLITTASLEEPNARQSEPVPVSPYAAAKAASGLYARMFHSLYGLPITILRPFMTYGPYQKHFKLVPYLIETMLRGEAPTVSSATRTVDMVYVEDVITAFLSAATSQSAIGQTIDLGSGTLISIREVADQIHTLIPNAPPVRYSSVNGRTNEITRRADIAVAADVLNWNAATSLREGLIRTVDWYRRQMKK